MDTVAPPSEWWTPLGVRLRVARSAPGPWNWLFLPGLAGIGSESLAELVDVLRVPGTSWLVDLPGSGSNSEPPGAPADPYRLWPDVLLEAVDALPNPVAVGHSGGGRQLLSVPDVERRLSGLVLISSAPDSGWVPAFEAMCAANPLPDVEGARERYEAHPTAGSLREFVIAAAPWHFTDEGLATGLDLLRRATYDPVAADWFAEHFDRTYVSRWWPEEVPTLIISGGQDGIVDQTLWLDPYYRGPNITHVSVDGAAHFPWLERPAAVRAAVVALTPDLRPRQASGTSTQY